MHWNVWSDGKATFKKQLLVPEAMIVSLAAMLVLFLALFSMGELSWFHYLPISHRSFGSMLQLSLSCFVARPSALEAMLRNMVWSWPVAAEAFNVRRATFLRLHSTCFSAIFCHQCPLKLAKRRFFLWVPWPAWSCRTMAHHAAYPRSLCESAGSDLASPGSPETPCLICLVLRKHQQELSELSWHLSR